MASRITRAIPVLARGTRSQLRTLSIAAPAPAPARRTTLQPLVSVPVARVQLGARYKSTFSSSNPIIKYDELKPITQQPTDDILLVDVREPDEVALGSIPSAVSLPLSQLKEALARNFNPGEFQKKFAFSKPLPEQNLIFFCRSGKRSTTASEWANQAGYKNVRNYEGSWLDWTKREKQAEEDD